MQRSLMLLALVGLLAACGGSQDAAPSSTPAAATETAPVASPAQIRVVNATNASAIRVRSGSTTITPEPVANGQWSQRFEAASGAQTLTFGPAGGGEAFATVQANLSAGGSYTLVLVGDYNVTGANAPQAVVLQDNYANGSAQARFVNAAVGAGDFTISDADGRGFAAGLAFGGATGWINVNGDNTNVNIATGGSNIATIDAPFAEGFGTTVLLLAGDAGVTAKFINDRLP